MHATFTIPFLDGQSASGDQFEDTVTIGTLAVQSQRVGAVSAYSSAFEGGGLMGMAFPSISKYPAPSVFQRLVAGGQLTQAVFGFTLIDYNAELFLGGADTNKYVGDPTYSPVATPLAYWSIALGGASVGTTTVFSLSVPAIIDTGTILIYGDSVNVKRIYDLIPGSNPAGASEPGVYFIPCDSSPDVSLTFGGTKFSISAVYFIQRRELEDGSMQCTGGIVAQDGTGRMQLLSSHYVAANVTLSSPLGYRCRVPQKCLQQCVLCYFLPPLFVTLTIQNRSCPVFDATPHQERVGFAALSPAPASPGTNANVSV